MRTLKSLKIELVESGQTDQIETIHGFSMPEAQKAGNIIGVDWDKVDANEFLKGMNVELEHRDITKGNRILTAKIVMAHLKELPDYYTRLAKMEKQGEQEKGKK